MSRRLGWAIVCALAFGCSESSAPPRLNVVVISLDTLRADALGAFGATAPTSPTFDAFARGAVVFDNAFAQAPMTAPSHMTLFTSLYPSVHRITNFGLGENRPKVSAGEVPANWRLDPKVVTLAETFHAAGWRTAAFHGGGNLNASAGFDDGFETFDGRPQNGMNANAGQPFDAARAGEWVNAHAGEPFFLFLHTYLPHAPYIPAAPWDRAFDKDYAGPIPYRDAFLRSVRAGEAGPPLPGADASALRQKMANHTPWQFWGFVDPENAREVEHLRALYSGDVRMSDDALARMLALLDSPGVAEHTIVVVLSDHGEGFLEHGVFEHPGKLYSELLHVPLAIRVPKAAPARVAAPVGLIDLYPTLCELAGLPIPVGLQGRSFADALRGAPLESEREVESEFVGRWRDTGGVVEPADLVRAWRTDHWTYLVTRKGEGVVEELYDRERDPGEHANLAADPERRAVLDELRAKVAAHESACASRRATIRIVPAGELDANTVDDLRALGYVR
ncbi:MAG: sulfatase-like hydrolase/transferase [Planctomycetes bacterium]|nr:sulfatase-like hydrolase/transferase [Planctomycetota bacterium]